MDKHLIVVSVDAMVFEDLEYAKNLPNFRRLLDGAAVIERVKTIYPSVTHPVHATLLTGAPAGVTGITNNLIFKPNAPDTDCIEWYNALGEIQCDTLLHAARRAGLKTAVSTWPVTAFGGGVVDYLVPSALNYYFDGHDDAPLDVYRRLGANEEVMEIIEKAVQIYGHRDVHPQYDGLQVYCAAELIRRYKPNLVMVHPGYVDGMRHAGGVFGEKVFEALKKTDEWLGELMSAVKDAGIEDSTDFAVVSDHGQINVTRVVSPNVWLADRGYITVSQDGTVKTWDAYVRSTGASALVYLSRPEDKALFSGVYELLKNMANEGVYGFEKVYTVDETREKYGLYGGFSFVLETDGYTAFGERCVRPAVTGFDFGDYRQSLGTHGHEPHKGPQPPFIGKGPSFKAGKVLPRGDILNHAPTFAKVLGIELLDAWGKPVDEILNG